ncbi:YgjV family protein [Massilia sp. 9096]|uniref:YgjV family protein n=1 Tax=Massilia sp. 9096 TaxID=1500894 RepID=UPI000691D5D8|nr:YgjV family protein [Massilia sp. 9096]
MTIDWFSPAQCVGYVAFVLGVGGFLQRDDRRFKQFMAAECLAYIVHFTLLGNPTATASSAVSMLRSVLALRTRSPWVVAFVLALNLGLGLSLAHRASDWLPLTASCLGTLALFLLEGVAMRALMLCGTALWIANNLIAGSIGGTALEIAIGAVNLRTTWLMARATRARPAGASADASQADDAALSP